MKNLSGNVAFWDITFGNIEAIIFATGATCKKTLLELFPISETVLIPGGSEDKYVNIYRWNARFTRARCNYLVMTESLYHVHYKATLNGHVIIDASIPRKDNPYHVIEVENGYKTA